MKVYTRTGDKGRTSLIGGERIRKDSLRVEVYGTLDETNTILGLARAFAKAPRSTEIIGWIQGILFSAGADLATPTSSRREVARLEEKQWRRLENLIDELDPMLPPLRNFILPGGTCAAGFIHFARSVCRRAERLLVRLIHEEGDVNANLLIFLNRLSDLLFVLARYENHLTLGQEEIWRKAD